MINNNEYIYGVHCGDSNCYACGTQRYNCDELNKLLLDDYMSKKQVAQLLQTVTIYLLFIYLKCRSLQYDWK